MSATSGRARSREARQQVIVSHVVARGVASVAELTELTGASVMTVHRDLDELRRRGILRKFHGGVSAQPSTVFESSSEYRLRAQVDAKRALAAAALSFVEPGMSVMLDDSTSVLALADRLGEVGPLTVVTNYLAAIQVLRDLPDVHVIGIGGDYSRTHDSFLGMVAVEAVSSFSVDVTFVSTSGMNATMTYHQEQEIVLIKRAMLRAGASTVLLMDSSKLGRTALHHLAPVSAYDHVILNADAAPELVAELSEATDVRLASPS